MSESKKVLNWFEIPVEDIDRAMNFYQSVLGWTLERQDSDRVKMAIIAQGSEVSGGALVQGEGSVPGKKGVLIYLNANVPQALLRVEKAGGRTLVQEKPVEGNWGRVAIIQDSEGNRIGLHQN